MDGITKFAWASLILLVFMVFINAVVFKSFVLVLLGIALAISGIYLLRSMKNGR